MLEEAVEEEVEDVFGGDGEVEESRESDAEGEGGEEEVASVSSKFQPPRRSFTLVSTYWVSNAGEDGETFTLVTGEYRTARPCSYGGWTAGYEYVEQSQ